jgi:hypothetical protein
VALEEAKDSIIGGVKADLDGRRLGSQSYFDKEEIIEKRGELHNELLRHVEVVGRRSATALQAGGNDAGHEVTVGGSDSVSSLLMLLLLSPWLNKVVGKNINNFILQMSCHVFQPILFSQKCH